MFHGDMKMPQSGYVYIVHGIGTNMIKVGKSTNLQQRLRHLENSAPFALQLVFAELVHDMETTERTLLQRYAAYRTRGEWFALPDHLLEQWPLTADIAPLTLRKFTPTQQPRHRQQEAVAWLHDYLRAGEVSGVTVLAAALAVGIRERTLWRAKAILEAEAIKRETIWYWRLKPATQE